MSDITNKLFGQRVLATKKMNKIWMAGGTRTWMSEASNINGVFLGVRFLQTGYMEREYGEYGEYMGEEYWVESGERIPTALIAESPHKNPVYVPLDCVRLIKEMK